VHGGHPDAEGQRELQSAWGCPQAVADALERAKNRVRMVLVSPGVFEGGWRPGWLTNTSSGWETPNGLPNCPSLRLRLVGVCNRRWQAVSGYSLEEGRVGPKAVRRLTPAGAVFFFEILSGKAADLAALWLQPVGDVTSRSHGGKTYQYDDGSDGFGLAVWGVW
jgi:CRISPR-associated protein Cmr3